MPDELSTKKVAELQVMLDEKNLPQNGKKADLINRLKRYEMKKSELENMATDIGVSKSGKKAIIIARIEEKEKEKAKEGEKESDEGEENSEEVPIREPSDADKEKVGIIGIVALRLSSARQIAVLKGLRWVNNDSKYDSDQRRSLNFGGTIGGEKIDEWFPNSFRLDKDEGELKVLATKYTESHDLPFRFSAEDDGMKLELMKPNDINFIQKPDWLDDINKDGTDKWDYDRNEHKCICVLIFLTHKEIDLRLIFSPDFEGLTDFPLVIRDGIQKVLDHNSDSRKGFFVQNEGATFEWKYSS